MRVVRAPDGAVRLDPTGRENGRGAYVCRDGDCLAHAGGRSALGHALRAEVPAELRAALAELATQTSTTSNTTPEVR
ncbi:MAG: YlxR family protein [Chloroflexi bacterium]|nr:YlxR family protein [Chloroflexota bacterium]